MGGDEDVVERQERRRERLALRARLVRVDVDGRARQVARAQRLAQGVDVHQVAARVVDEAGAGLHAGDGLRVDHPAGELRGGDVQGHHVREPQELLQRPDRPRVAVGELGLDVVVVHVHPEPAGQHRELRPDVAVADDAQVLGPGLVGALDRLEPLAAAQAEALLRDPAQQHDRRGQRQLRDRAGVGEGRVEHGDAVLGGGLQVHLVGPDAEAADGQEVLRGADRPGVQVRARADPDQVAVGHRLGDARLDGARAPVDLDAFDAAERGVGAGVDVLGEQGLRGHGVSRPRVGTRRVRRRVRGERWSSTRPRLCARHPAGHRA